MEKKRMIMTEELFKNIKTLLAHGMTSDATASALRCGKSTVYRVKRVDTLADYYESIKPVKPEAPKPEAPKPEAPKPEPITTPVVTPMQSGYQMNRMLELAKEQNELLKSISAKLAFIVEQLS